MRESERGKKRERQKIFQETVQGKCPSTEQVFQVDIQIQGRNSTLVPDTSILLGVTLEMQPLHSPCPSGIQGLNCLALLYSKISLCAHQGKEKQMISLRQKSPSHVKCFLYYYCPHYFLVFSIQAIENVYLFQADIYSPPVCLYCAYLG